MRPLFLPTLILWLLISGCSKTPELPVRPNLLVIITDDQRNDMLGLENPILQTPVMDRLATEGTRFVMVGVDSRIGKTFRFPAPPSGSSTDLFLSQEPYWTSSDALSDLGEPLLDEPQAYTLPPANALQAFLRIGSNKIHNHTPTKHSEETLAKLKVQKPGTGLYNWNHSWFKLDPELPSRTVKMNNRAPAVHYSQPRLITPRECARLQTIPDRVVLAGNKTHQLKQIGNAVPSIMAAHLATSIALQCFDVRVEIPWNTETSPLESVAL